MVQIEIDNLNYLIKKYKNSKGILLGVDYLSQEDTGIDIVVYDVSSCDIKEDSIECFHEYVGKVGADEESYEMDRVTLVRGKK